MSRESAEIARNVAVEVQQQQAQAEPMVSNFLLQSLMVDDRYLKEILKGEILEPLNMLEGLMKDYMVLERIDKAHYDKIMELLMVLNDNFSRFRRCMPYLILTSHLMRLTYITQKDAKALKRRVSIMIRRDLLDIDEEELELADVNFFEALKIMCWNAIDDSVEGYKLRAVTEQKKFITTEFTEPKRKKKWGIF